jgi:hypothetical protein
MKDIYDFIKSFDLHTIIVVSIAFYFLNGNISQLAKEVQEIRSDLRVIRTVLVMKNIMPTEMAVSK